MTKQIGMVCPNPSDPTSYYRGIGPFFNIAKSNENIRLKDLSAIRLDRLWIELKDCDLVFMQRPCSPEHFTILCKAKDLGIPVWSDFDDDNLSVPKDNPTYYQYNQLAIKDAIIKLARHSDVLTVSTKFLHKKYSIYNKNCQIVPNAIDDSLLHLRQIPPRPRDKKVLWRGNPSHTRNLMSVGQQIINISARHPEIKFTFFGFDPIDLTDRIKNHEIAGCVDIIDYHKIMMQIHATVLIYPLINTDHAQARSHISWLEATFANTLCLASKNEEFTRPGLITFSSPGEFEDQLEAVLRGDIDIDNCVETSWAEIQDKYLLSKINVQRLEILKTLLNV